jgi:hypothetical protein
MLYLFVFLKLPIVAACAIIWWAVKQGPESEQAPNDGGSPRRTRPHPRPKRPRPPRRGPHAGARPPSPPRIRSVTAVGRHGDMHPRPRGSSRPMGDNSH